MTVTLQPHQERAIQDAIKAGRFHSVEEFIDSAVQTLAPPNPESGLVEVDGVLIYRGTWEAGADPDTLIDQVREERIRSLVSE